MQFCVSVTAPEMHFIAISLYCTVQIIFEIEDFIVSNLVLHIHAAQSSLYNLQAPSCALVSRPQT